MTAPNTPSDPGHVSQGERVFGPTFPRRQRPPWWPENEPWPPRQWTPRRWLWRVALLFLTLFAMVVAFGVFVAWTSQLLFEIGPRTSANDMSWMMREMPTAWLLPRVFVGGGALILFVIGFTSVARHLVRTARPVDELMQAAQKVAGGDYTVRVAETGARETRNLARTFNAMTTQLQTNDQQRRRLLADVTHELRTPLTVIQGGLEAVLDGVHPADPSHLNTILDETRVMGRLIDDLRTLALAEAGALRLMREPVDLIVLANEAAAAFQAQAQATGVTLAVETSPDLPLADLDPLRIREVLTNLIANALRYTPVGGRITVTAQVDSPERLRVTVSDTGAGIPPERLAHIFDRFYKSDESHGSGLGLAIAQSLVESHGGTLQVESTIGAGTTFTIRLPLQETVA